MTAKPPSSRCGKHCCLLAVLILAIASLTWGHSRLKLYVLQMVEPNMRHWTQIGALQDEVSALVEEVASLKGQLGSTKPGPSSPVAQPRPTKDQGRRASSNAGKQIRAAKPAAFAQKKKDQARSVIGKPTMRDRSAKPTAPPRRNIPTVFIAKDAVPIPRLNLTVDVIREQESLWHGAALKASVDRPYIAETIYHHGDFPITKIVNGGGAAPYFPKGVEKKRENLVWPAKNKEEAVCILRSHKTKNLANKTPHNLQQVLRCFSWWKQNPTKTPVLRLRRLHTNDFIKDMYKALETVFGVQIQVRPDLDDEDESTGPAVTVDHPFSQIQKQLDTYVINSGDAKQLSDGILSHYLPNNKDQAGCNKHANPVIAFVNREGSRRALKNHEEVLSALKTAGYEVIYKDNFDDVSLVKQAKFMSEADIVMGPHGAQFTTTLFQPQCGALFEFFVEGYYAPNFFGSLAAISGKHHFFTYNGGDISNQSNRKQREEAYYSVSPDAVLEMTHMIVDRWHDCCQYGFRSG